MGKTISSGLRAWSGAFTLIEILISTTLLAFLVLMLGQTLGYMSGAWRRGEAHVSKSQDARAICDFIAKEIQEALLPVNRTSTTNLQFVVNPDEFSSGFRAANGIFGDALFWQAPIAADKRLGDLAEVGYFLKWDESRAGNPRARLCRFFVEPVVAHSSPAVPNTDYFLIYSQPQAWLTQAVLDNVAPADKDHAYQGLFVENVLGLWVTCLGPDGSPITTNAKGEAFAANHYDSRAGYIYATGTQAACALPSAIDLSFVLLDGNLAGRIGPAQKSAIETLAAGERSAGAFVSRALVNADLGGIRSGLRPFTMRIFLKNSK